MTERERAVLAVVAGMLCCAVVGWLGFSAGALRERLERPLVCGDSLNPSGVRVVPRYRPSGPVTGGTP